jgi:hypothetical protein
MSDHADTRRHLVDALNGRMPKTDVAWTILATWDALAARCDALERHVEDARIARDDEYQRAEKLLARCDALENALPYEIGEETYLWLPDQLREIYEPIHEDETPTLERCFRRRAALAATGTTREKHDYAPIQRCRHCGRDEYDDLHFLV